MVSLCDPAIGSDMMVTIGILPCSVYHALTDCTLCHVLLLPCLVCHAVTWPIPHVFGSVVTSSSSAFIDVDLLGRS